MPYSAAARAQVDRFHDPAARHARMMGGFARADEANRTIVSARTKGLMAMLAPGWRVYALDEGSDARLDDRGRPRGGIIVETTGTRTVTDDGELHDDRAFRCIDPTDGARVVLPERSVDPTRIAAFDRWETWQVMARLAAPIAALRTRKASSRSKGLLEHEHDLLDAVADIERLARCCTVGGALSAPAIVSAPVDPEEETW